MYESVEKSRAAEKQVATLLDPETYEALAEKATAAERSLAAELRVAVKKHLGIAA